MVETSKFPAGVERVGSDRPREASREWRRTATGRGHVVALALASGKGLPMVRVEAVEVDRNGIACDRYRESRGHWSGRGPAAVTLLSLDEVVEASRVLGTDLDPLLLRRNVLVEEIDLSSLEGRRFRVGGVVLEGHEACAPCRYLEKLLDLPGLQDALRGRGGLRASVVSGGRMRVGDAVEALVDTL